jgi:hypothetical protein
MASVVNEIPRVSQIIDNFPASYHSINALFSILLSVTGTIDLLVA